MLQQYQIRSEYVIVCVCVCVCVMESVWSFEKNDRT